MHTNNILALDLGTKMGWALALNNIYHNSGTLNLNPNPKKNKGAGRRFINFVNFLDKINKDFGLNCIFYEKVVAHKGTFAAHVYGGFQSHLFSWCETNNIECKGISVQEIKKSITGRGTANKLDVIKAVQNKGYKPIDDNNADAIALLLNVIP